MTVAEVLKTAIRRSLPMIIALCLLGVIAVNAFKFSQGPRYDASARVLIVNNSLSSIITDTQPSFIDPQRIQQTAIGVAGSPRLYQLAEAETGGALGTAGDLRAATTVTGDPISDLITFSATDPDPDRAVRIVNAVAVAFVEFRDELSSEQITSVIEGLDAELAKLPEGSPERSELQAQLSKLQVLKDNSGDAEFVQPADSANKSSPNPVRDSIVGFSIGLVIALLLVALREAVDTTVRSEADVEELLSVPVLASVRSLPRGSRIVTHGRHEAAFADTYALLAAQLLRDDGGVPANAGGGRILAVTSSLSKEGKTTTAANLAIAMARRGSDVLLADFDFRRPEIAQLFALKEDAPGSIQVVAGEATLQSVLWSVAVGDQSSSSGIGSLHLLPAGAPVGPRDLPQRSELAALLRDMRARADVVILDTPPALLTVEVAEISSLIDSVVVVVRQGRVSRRNLRAFGRQARSWSVNISGAVMTGVATGTESYYHRGR